MKRIMIWAVLFVLCCSFIWAKVITPTPKKVPMCDIIDILGNKYTGRILYASDSFLVFWNTTKKYDSTKLNDFVIQRRYAEIQQIHTFKKGKFSFCGAGIGIALCTPYGFSLGEKLASYYSSGWEGFNYLIGGIAVGILVGTVGGGLIGRERKQYYDITIDYDYNKYKSQLLNLKKISIFPYTPPIELQEFINQPSDVKNNEEMQDEED